MRYYRNYVFLPSMYVFQALALTPGIPSPAGGRGVCSKRSDHGSPSPARSAGEGAGRVRVYSD